MHITFYSSALKILGFSNKQVKTNNAIPSAYTLYENAIKIESAYRQLFSTFGLVKKTDLDLGISTPRAKKLPFSGGQKTTRLTLCTLRLTGCQCVGTLAQAAVTNSSFVFLWAKRSFQEAKPACKLPASFFSQWLALHLLSAEDTVHCWLHLQRQNKHFA